MVQCPYTEVFFIQSVLYQRFHSTLERINVQTLCDAVSRKEMERFAHERDQLVSQALPEHLKMVAVATGGTVSLSDVIRLQGARVHNGS